MVLAVVVAVGDLLVAVVEGGVWGEDHPPPLHYRHDQAIRVQI